MKKIIACGLVGVTLLFSGSIQADEVTTSSMTKYPASGTMDIQNKSDYHNENIGKAHEVKTHFEHNKNGESNFKLYEAERTNKHKHMNENKVKSDIEQRNHEIDKKR